MSDEFPGVFNGVDIDGIMSFLTGDAVYEEVRGKVSDGKAAIRRSSEILFSGRFGTIRLDADDTFIDADAGKVMRRWHLHLEMEGRPVALAGLDLLYFDGSRVSRKLTYMKPRAGLYEPA